MACTRTTVMDVANVAMLGTVFKVELIGFANASDVEYERKTNSDCKILGLSNWKEGGAIYEDGEDWERKIVMEALSRVS